MKIRFRKPQEQNVLDGHQDFKEMEEEILRSLSKARFLPEVKM